MSIFTINHIVKTKHKLPVTSTPIKQIKSQDQGLLLGWPSPLDQKSAELLSPMEHIGKKKSSEKAVDSMDKICLVNRSPELPSNKPEAVVTDKVDVKVKTNKVKQLIIMDSDEEELFWKTSEKRNSDTQKEKNAKRKRIKSKTHSQRDIGTEKTAKILDPVTSTPDIENTDTESIYNGLILPKVTAAPKIIVPPGVTTLPESSLVEQKESVAPKRSSMDKICLVNRSPELPSNKPEAVVTDKADVEVKTNKVKQLIIMDSDEEELFWKTSGKKNSDDQKEKNAKGKRIKSKTHSQSDIGTEKTAKILDPVSPMQDIENTDTESIYNGLILPKVTAALKKIVPPGVTTLPKSSPVKQKESVASKSSLKRSKELEDSNGSNNIVERLRKRKETDGREEEITVRRSNRKRCKPLEFWNGERLGIERDLTSGIKKLVRGKKNTNEKKVQDEEKAQGIEQNEAANMHDSSSKDIRKRKSILKSHKKSKATGSVRFSTTIETGITTDTPAIEKSEKIDWLKNFDRLNSRNELKPDQDNCVILQGLNTARGSVSSSVIHMRPKSTKQSRVPHLHALVFCLTSGAVTVTIANTSAQIKTYGHFAVPGGISYRIENLGRRMAVLSSFKFACGSS